ncbi:CLUMA_CG003507, isoform A [Clunio marinus]|uniref:CLUMA_CG003507, isoform A n=1 Tax=Clunio marinus TaxID=568069 RepID=A0A1J1HUJ2_9DIPT|nr:CLUMA_CG003507, isoform A [Clunio marinus]
MIDNDLFSRSASESNGAVHLILITNFKEIETCMPNLNVQQKSQNKNKKISINELRLKAHKLYLALTSKKLDILPPTLQCQLPSGFIESSKW